VFDKLQFVVLSTRQIDKLKLIERYATAAAASFLKTILSPAADTLTTCPDKTSPFRIFTASGFCISV
jgi:hypothetical protein